MFTVVVVRVVSVVPFVVAVAWVKFSVLAIVTGADVVVVVEVVVVFIVHVYIYIEIYIVAVVCVVVVVVCVRLCMFIAGACLHVCIIMHACICMGVWMLVC